MRRRAITKKDLIAAQRATIVKLLRKHFLMETVDVACVSHYTFLCCVDDIKKHVWKKIHRMVSH